MPQRSRKSSEDSAERPSSLAGDGQRAADRERPLTRAERRAEVVRQRRAERRTMPARKRRERLILRIAAGTIAALLVGGLAYGTVTWIQDREYRRPPEGVTVYSYAGGEHTLDTVDYPESPPVGGPHDPVWQTCDFYDGVIRNENAVHSLEHGVVWITYRPDIDESEKDKLRSFTRGDRYVLVSAYPDQESPIVATAWNHQLEIATADQKELRQFVNYYRQGPQTPEPGATCERGTTAVIG